MMERDAMTKRRPSISVIGGGRCTAEEALLAYDVGREIARRGAVLICGGLGGVMEAACRGAVDCGGTTVGIMPGTSSAEANAYVTVAVVTGMGEARNVIVASSGDAVIAVGGELGTLSEIALALKRGVAVIGVRTWNWGEEQQGRRFDVVRASSAQEAVELALASLS